MSLAGTRKSIEELRAEPVESFLTDLVESLVDGNLAKIARILSQPGVYEVFLPERARCGMISARDVLKSTNIEGTKPTAIMHYVPVIHKRAAVAEAARLMADYRFRAVPISDGHTIIGQVNSVSLLAKLRGSIGREMRITSISTKNPVTVETGTSIAKARELMIRRRIDHVPVTREGRLKGMFTSTDIISRMSPPERIGSKSMKPETRGPLDFPVGDAMDSNPLTSSPDTTVEQALGSILSTARTYVLVTQWEELQGIATYRDFMTLLAAPEPESEVPIFMVGLPDDPFEAEATKAKFKRTINQLHRIFPDILEARSVIKAKFSRPGKERGRYEVKVHIRTTRDLHSYSEEGWELPAVYDVITDRLKRLMSQKQRPRRARARETPQAL